MKKVFVLLLVFIMIISLFAGCGEEKNNSMDSTDKSTNATESKIDLSNIQVGEYVKFGKYEQDNNEYNGKEDIEWLVLEKKDEKALLISKYGLDFKYYNDNLNDYVTWETCFLRKWLNNEFINSVFDEQERAMIPAVTISTAENPEYHSVTEPGNATQDRVFVLSIQEAEKYFSSDVARQCKPTDYAIANGVRASSRFEGNCHWYLRSPGYVQNLSASVEANGEVYEFGLCAPYDYYAVRPSIWLSTNNSVTTAEPTPNKVIKPTTEVLPIPTSTPIIENKKNKSDSDLTGIWECDDGREAEITGYSKDSFYMEHQKLSGKKFFYKCDTNPMTKKKQDHCYTDGDDNYVIILFEENLIYVAVINYYYPRGGLGLFGISITEELPMIGEENNSKEEKAYLIAIDLYLSKHYTDAIEAFKVLNNYKDSAKYIDLCEKELNLYFESEYTAIKNAVVGEKVFFGFYEQNCEESDGKEKIEWNVISKDNNYVLLQSAKYIDAQVFNSEKNNSGWTNSTLRDYLNSTFIENAFSADEQSVLRKTRVSQKEYNGDSPQTTSTIDKVFILSSEEMKHYKIEKAEPTLYAKNITDDYLYVGKWNYADSNVCWLRDAGRNRAFQNSAVNGYEEIIDEWPGYFCYCVQPVIRVYIGN